MTLASFSSLPSISSLITAGDISVEEVTAIFADFAESDGGDGGDGGEETVLTASGFAKAHGAVDDLFEYVPVDGEASGSEAPLPTDENEPSDAGEPSELTAAFHTLAPSGTLSYDALLQWEEVKALLDDSLLSTAELRDLWNAVSQEKEEIDLEGFLTFGERLDDLFMDGDNEGGDEGGGEEEGVAVVWPEGAGLREQFEMLRRDGSDGSDGGITFSDLFRSEKLRLLVSDGSLLVSELEEFFVMCSAGGSGEGAMDGEGYERFDAMVEDLFEDEDEEGEGEVAVEVEEVATGQREEAGEEGDVFEVRD